MMRETLVILAGGVSSRMKRSAGMAVADRDSDQANRLDKGLIGVGEEGRPMMDYLLNNALHAGYERIIIVTGEDNAALKSYYGEREMGNQFRGLSISYAVQKIPADRVKPWGTADALLQALLQYPELQKQSFTVCNSDNLYSVSVLSALLEVEPENAWIDYDRSSLELAKEKIMAFAVTKSDEGHRLLEIVEKPTEDQLIECTNPDGTIRVSMNIFRFKGTMIFPELLNCPVHPARKEKELPTAILAMIRKHPGAMQGVPMCEHVPDLTEKKDILVVREFLKTNYPRLIWEK